MARAAGTTTTTSTTQTGPTTTADTTTTGTTTTERRPPAPRPPTRRPPTRRPPARRRLRQLPGRRPRRRTRHSVIVVVGQVSGAGALALVRPSIRSWCSGCLPRLSRPIRLRHGAGVGAQFRIFDSARFHVPVGDGQAAFGFALRGRSHREDGPGQTARGSVGLEIYGAAVSIKRHEAVQVGGWGCCFWERRSAE